jgi:small-conductance mechanosensitive channel
VTTARQRRFGPGLLGVLVLALVLPGSLRGQEQGDSMAAGVPEPSPVSAPELGGVNTTLREIAILRARLADRGRIEALAEEVQGLEERFTSTIADPLLNVPVERLDRGRAQELLRLLSRLSPEVARATEALEGALSDVIQIQDSLRTYDERWSRVVDGTDSVDVAPQLEATVRSLLALADSGRAEAGVRAGELTALEGRVVALDTRIADLAVAAQAREQVLLGDLLDVDAGPIWTLLGDGTGGELARNVAAVPERVRLAVGDLVSAYRGRLVLHGLAALFFLGLVLGIRRSPALADATDLPTAHRILAHPVAVSLLLTLALTQPLYPTAQPAVVALNTVFFLAAELVVLQAALPFLPPMVVWSGGAFLAAARLSYLLPFDTVGHRLAFLLSSAGTLVLLRVTSGLLRKHPDRVGVRSRRVMSGILLAFAVLLGVAMVANVLGMVDLAVLVTRSTIRSLLSGLGLLTLALVLRDLVEVGLRTGPVKRLSSVRSQRSRITASVRRLITGAGLLAWIWATLEAFRLLDPLARTVGALMEFRLEVGAVGIAPATVVIFGLSVWLAVYVSRVTRFFLDHDVLPRLSLPRGVPGAISTSLHYVIVGLALAFGVTAMGLDLSSLAFVVGALGVGIGFGLQNIINNFISGLILLFERPIQVGDEVKIGQLMGTMKRIGIRASIVRTYEGSEVIVPNGDLISQQVINYTLSDRFRRMELRVGVAYGTDLDRAREAIVEALESIEQILEEPAPAVFFNGFGESSLDFRVLFWVPDFQLGLETGSALGMAVNQALTEADIVIPFPQRDLHLRTAPVLDEVRLGQVAGRAGSDAAEG